MTFYGVKRTITFDDDFVQMKSIEDFWEQMWSDFPSEYFVGLGTNWNANSLDYYIGKVGERWQGGLHEVQLPGEGWQSFTCKRTDEQIKEMYQKIWSKGALDYEIEELQKHTLVVKVHYAVDKEIK